MSGARPSRRIALAAGVALLALLPYAQTASFGPTYDDHHHVVDHPLLNSPRAAQVLFSAEYFAYELPDQARPVLLASLLLDRALFGDDFGGAHLASALWHVLSSLLVLALAGTLGWRMEARAAGAALFAVHPACTEAVASVSNREDLLVTVFLLLALLSARRALRDGWAWLVPSAASLLLALGSKESAVAAPLLMAVLSLSSPEWRARASRPRLRWAALALVALACLGAWGALQLHLGAPSLRVGAGGEPLAGGARPLAMFWPILADAGSGFDVGWASVLSVAAYRALRLTIGWPLSAEHDVEWLGGPLAVAIGGLVCAALVTLAARSWRRGRVWSLGVGWALVASLPTLASPWLLNPVADRFLYTPLVGVALAWGATLAGRPWPSPRRFALFACLSFALPYAASRVAVWRDDVSLFADAVTHAPRSARAWQNLGAAHLHRGELDHAATALERATELRADGIAAHLNLGVAELGRGNDERALRALERAATIDPMTGEEALHARAFATWAHHLHRLGRRQRLRRAVEEELARTPTSRTARSWRQRLSHEGSRTE